MKGDALTALRSQKLLKPLKNLQKEDSSGGSPVEQSILETVSHRNRETRTTSTMSLYSTDLAQIKWIRRTLEDSGIKRVSDSEAVRVALRAIVKDKDVLVKAFQEMATDDGRKRNLPDRS